jgi:hypothetical protein
VNILRGAALRKWNDLPYWFRTAASSGDILSPDHAAVPRIVEQSQRGHLSLRVQNSTNVPVENALRGETTSRAGRASAGCDLVEPLGQGVPRQGGALEAHGELHDTLEGLEVAEFHLGVGRRGVGAGGVAAVEARLVDGHESRKALVSSRTFSRVVGARSLRLMQAQRRTVLVPWPGGGRSVGSRLVVTVRARSLTRRQDGAHGQASTVTELDE